MKLKAAVIGLGVGERHAETYHKMENCELYKVCDFDTEKLNRISKKFNCLFTKHAEEILIDQDIDLISIASYDNFHADQVITALENGKHVFVEKPICLTNDELEGIVKALNKNPSLRLSSNFVLRENPYFKDLKNNLEKNEFGSLYYLEGDYNYGRLFKLTDGWRGDVPNYSVMHGGGIHLIDIICWLINKKAIEVIGVSNNLITSNTKFNYSDLSTAFIRFEGGAISKITANFGSVTPHHHRLSVYGSKTTFIHDFEKTTYYFERENPDNKLNLSFEKNNASKKNVLEDFVRSIITNEDLGINKKEVIDVMTISLAIENSIRTKKWQKVEYKKLI